MAVDNAQPRDERTACWKLITMHESGRGRLSSSPSTVQRSACNEFVGRATHPPSSAAVSRIRFNDRDETNAVTTPLIRQRQEQASAYYRQQLYEFSRPSSSSGSTHTLRRTPKFDDPRKQSRLRSTSLDSPRRFLSPKPEEDQPVSPVRTASPYHRRAASARPSDSVPHPALRISNRTRSAVLYALEEALRKPNSFSIDPEEENAQMSDLGGGRASNGGARIGGPVPVPSSGTPTGLKTPRDVMRNRQEREARRQEEAQKEEQRRAQYAEDRRRSAEMKAAAAAAVEPRYPYTPETAQQGFPGSRLSGSGQVASGADYGVPTGRMIGTGDSGYVSGAQSGRRAASASVAQDQPRPAQPATISGRRSQSQSIPRQPQAGQQAGGGASSSTAPPVQPPQQPTSGEGKNSSFPHAFERWEQLSSHWEGLTSYWLRKLEADAEDIQRSVPSASSMSRQITDLSAAGANLFHAVVELQRLRASSERKFQRWFFETRADTERNSETRAQLEQQLQTERSERQRNAKQRVESEIAAENARREVAEMRRELMISKEEARRAWEELGRRNQESLELAESLKNGRITVVSGVQVVPYFGQPSRTGSANQRPTTREGPQYGSTPGATSAAAAGFQSPGEEYYQEGESPTNTDPFTETKPLHHEPDVQSLATGTYQPYPLSSPHGNTTSAASGASAQTAIPMSHPRPVSSGQLGTPRTPTAPAPTSSPSAQPFYHQPPRETFLHSPQPPTTQALRPQTSYVDTLSEGETEYAIDPAGNIRHDDHGNPIIFRRAPPSSENDSDDYAPLRHDPAIASRYGTGAVGGSGQLLPEAPTIPATSAQAMQSYTPTSSAAGQAGPDYEGEGYGGWEPVPTTRHHHPTRLSDVLEEEEERSSRRTGE